MTLRPELTFSRAVRAVLRWWWFVLVSGLILMAAAYLLASRSSGIRHEGKVRLHVVNTVVSYSPRGDPIAATVVPRTTNEVNPESFLVAEVAEQAAARTGVVDIGPRRLLAKLVAVPLSPTDVELRYTFAPRAEVAGALAAYATEYVDWKRAQQERGLTSALASLAESLTDVRKTLRSLRRAEAGQDGPSATLTAYEARRLELESGVDMLELAVHLLPEQVALVGEVEVASRRVSLPVWLAAAGGLAAGLVAGVLLVLVLIRFDPRVRRSADVQLPGVRVVDVGRNRLPEAMQRLRSELELTGLGRDAQVLIVSSPTRVENRNGIALAIARAFAAAETPTVLVSADFAAQVEQGPPASAPKYGAAEFLEGRLVSLQLAELAENLVWIPRGEVSEPSSVLVTADRLERLLVEARTIARVVVFEAPPLDDVSGLLTAASGDLTLLVVQRGKTRWTELAQALELVGGAVGRPVQICFDPGTRRARTREEAEEAPLGNPNLSAATSARV